MKNGATTFKQAPPFAAQPPAELLQSKPQPPARPAMLYTWLNVGSTSSKICGRNKEQTPHLHGHHSDIMMRQTEKPVATCPGHSIDLKILVLEVMRSPDEHLRKWWQSYWIKQLTSLNPEGLNLDTWWRWHHQPTDSMNTDICHCLQLYACLTTLEFERSDKMNECKWRWREHEEKWREEREGG